GGPPERLTRLDGSVFYANEARMTWELRRVEEESADLVVALYNRKANGARLQPPVSLRFAFEPELIRATGTDLGESPDLLARATVTKRVLVALGTGALTTAELAQHLDKPEDTVGRIIRRLREKGQVVAVGDARPYRWGLAGRR